MEKMLAKGRPRSPSCAESVASAPQSQLCSTKRAMRAASSGGGMVPRANAASAAAHRNANNTMADRRCHRRHGLSQAPRRRTTTRRGVGRVTLLSANRRQPARLSANGRWREAGPSASAAGGGKQLWQTWLAVGRSGKGGGDTVIQQPMKGLDGALCQSHFTRGRGAPRSPSTSPSVFTLPMWQRVVEKPTLTECHSYRVCGSISWDQQQKWQVSLLQIFISCQSEKYSPAPFCSTLQHAWCRWRNRAGVQQSMKRATPGLLGSFPHSSLWQSSMGRLLAQDPAVCKAELTAKIIQVTVPRVEYSALMASAKEQPYGKERVSPPVKTAKAFSPRVLFAIGSPQHPKALLAKPQKPHWNRQTFHLPELDMPRVFL